MVAAPDTAPVAQRYAALCAGVAIGEHVRDTGGKAIVLLDSAECMVAVWKTAIALALGGAAQQDNGALHTFFVCILLGLIFPCKCVIWFSD